MPACAGMTDGRDGLGNDYGTSVAHHYTATSALIAG